MTFGELLRLSHREFTAYKTRSRTTIVTIGILFGMLLAALLIIQGLENVVVKYAGDAMDGYVYLASTYEGVDDDSVVLARIKSFDGEVVALTSEQKAEIGEKIPESVIIAKFSNLDKAYEYYNNSNNYQVVELFSNQIGVYRYFRDKNRDFVLPISVVLVVVSAFILAFTMAHLIASSTKTFVLYRSIGASRWQLLLIFFVYLLELCVWAAVFAVILALILAGIATGVCWNSLLVQLTAIYPNAPNYWPILVGVNLRCIEVILCMFLAAPVSFLLCLDQFSSKKTAQKLKGD